MISSKRQDGLTRASAVVSERCRQLDLLTLRCDVQGRPLSGGGMEPCANTVAAAFLRSGLILARLRRLSQEWAQQEQPTLGELFEGCWCFPLIEMRRRRRTGYLVVIALERRALDAEHFNAACQSASLDTQAARTALGQLAVHEPGGVARLWRLLRWTQCDRLELALGEDTLGDFSSQLAEAYEEISLLYKLGQSMNEVVMPDKFVRLLCDELQQTLSFGWVGAWFSSEYGAPSRLAGQCVVAGKAPMPAGQLGAEIERLSPSLGVIDPTVLTADAAQSPALTARGSYVLVHPLARDGSLVGALLAGDKRGDDTEVSSVDTKLLDASAGNLRVMLENAALYEDQQSMFMGTLEALTAAIDAKDRYTCGHSDRVAHMSMLLASAMGLDDERVERVRIAGLVHDVGKIGVPESVLCKPGKLTDDEFEIIKEHPEMGRRILRDIPQLQDILPAVMHHHERWDGRGYPHGLCGESIPVYARLVGVADAFDAMSSTRTYRSAMPRDRALREISRCAGTQFDPSMASVFVDLDFSVYDEMVSSRPVMENRDCATGEAA